MPLISFRLRAVAGRTLVDPFTLGVQRRFLEGEQVLRETTDHYYKKAVLAGDADYVETVLDAGEKSEKATRDPELVRATVVNVKARAAAADAAAKHEADVAKALKLELEAADAGLSVEVHQAQFAAAADAAGAVKE